MSRFVRHIYSTSPEANAFVDGVQWVNDDMVEVQAIEDGEDEFGPFATVVCIDSLGGKDYEHDHREPATND